jgi:hypothetical protein
LCVILLIYNNIICFIGLALRNDELLKSNDQLKQQLADVLKELNGIKKEREEKAARREKWSKRKRLPKRDPINSEIYNLLIKESEGPTYIATRTRIAICLLTVTGIRIGELLSLKVGQLETLLEEGWISIDRLKRGPDPYDLADVKTQINWGRGNEDLEAAAERMGKKIKQQRSRMQSYGKTPLDIVDLRKLNPSEKTDFKQNVIDTIGSSKDLVFVNDEVKS